MTGSNPYVHAGGIPLGQRQLLPYKPSGTEYLVEGDDLHFVNNPAIQQMWDDIRRTIIVGLDMAHEVLRKRLGKEVTPETINNYLEILNHAMPGAAVVQEHIVETHPGLVDDCNVRVFTGDDALADEIDPQYLIDINKVFPAEQAEQLKAAIGKTTWQAIHIPTIVVRSCDGGTTSRWSAMQLCMTFIDAYNMCAGEAAVADLAYAAKHAAVLQMSEMLPARRARGPNNPGGLSFGFLADMVQTSQSSSIRSSQGLSERSCRRRCALRSDLVGKLHVRRCRFHTVRHCRLHQRCPGRLLLLRSGLGCGQIWRVLQSSQDSSDCYGMRH